MTTTPGIDRPLLLGTRRSELATTQSGHVADMLRARGLEVELVLVTTEGDTNRAPLSRIGGTGVFVSALRDALLDGSIDLAVHSLKDLPVEQPAGLVVAATPSREDSRDVLVARDGLTLESLPAGARVGTGSPRREAQLRATRPDLDVRELRGNVPTRIATVTDGELDAVVLAGAGIRRLGLTDAVTQWLEPTDMVCAPGQGALAVECRADDAAVRAHLEPLDDPATRAAVTAERAVLGALEAGCSAPVGAFATVADGELALRTFAGPREGGETFREEVTASLADAPDPLSAAEALGRRTGTALRTRGADALPGVGEVPQPADRQSSKETE